MQTTEYKVAIHSFRVNLAEGDSACVLPSFTPFVQPLDNLDRLLFVLTVDPDFRPAQKGESIGEFDSGGADFDVYRLPDGGYQYLISAPGGSFDCFLETNADFSQGRATLRCAPEHQGFYINNCLMLMYAFASAPYYTLLMHASVIANSGRAFAFLGVSGTGKSTHSCQWLKYIEGSELMNDDNPVFCLLPDGTAHIYGSPWSGKTPCYRNVEAPIGAFVHIKQAKVNHIEREPVLHAFSSLLISCSTMKWDKRIYDFTCDTLSQILERVPIYQLECRPDEEAALVCHEALFA